MILNQRDTHPAIRDLERRLADPALSLRDRHAAELELRRRRSGERGEAHAAHIMNIHYGRSCDLMVIHDLRIEHEGVSAQIDHLIVGRLLDIWVCESKRSANGIKITEHGEFLTFVHGRPRGIDSPIEQNLRHIKVLGEAFAAGAVTWPTRLGFRLTPKLRSLVLISNGAINRPRGAVRGIDTVIMTDQLHAAMSRAGDNGNPLDLAKLVSPATLEGIGRQLVAMHRPVRQTLPPRLPTAAGSPPPANVIPISAAVQLPQAPCARDWSRPDRAAAACYACTLPISAGIVAYCRAAPARFNGRLLCRRCQEDCLPQRHAH